MRSNILPIFLVFTLATLAHSRTADDVDSDHDVREVTRIPIKSMSSCRRGADFSNEADISHVPAAIRKLFDWSNYRNVFGKHYKNALEEASRLFLFTGRLAKISRSLFAYLSGCSNFYLTVNKFSDRTKNELRQLDAQKPDKEMFLGEQVENSHTKRPKKAMVGKKNFGQCFVDWMDESCQEIKTVLRKTKQPTDSRIVDWTTSPDECLQAPRDQGDCGCCYAMATVKLYEWLHCRQKNNQQVKYSEQFIVDCGHLSGLNGCKSGNSRQTMKFIESFGLIPEEKYNPFSANVQTCPLGPNSSDLPESNMTNLFIKPSNMEYKILRGGSTEWETALTEQPLVVFLQLEEEFLDYGGGIYESGNCNPDYGHFLLLVGHGFENGRPYWLLSNSFGTEWGLNGYIKLSKNQDKCVGYVLKATADFNTQ